MSSVDGVGSSSYSSSVYGNRNILSGLASGMDTESMIENSIQGYKQKIQNLINQQTKVTWQQDAFRSVTDKMIGLSQKYTSYSSKTNLSSRSFFNNAVNTTTSGKHAEKVSATGRTTSEVKINAVKQLASAARYSVAAGADLVPGGGAAVGEAFTLPKTKMSTVDGNMTICAGASNKKVTIKFDQPMEGDIFETAQEMVDAINKKLSKETIGDKKADTLIKAELQEDGNIVLSGDKVWIYKATGKLRDTLQIEDQYFYEENHNSLIVSEKLPLYEEQESAAGFSNKTVDVTLDGVTKKVSTGNLILSDEEKAKGVTVEQKLVNNLQKSVQDAFGGKVKVERNKNGALSFTTASQNSSLKVTSEVGEALGLGKNGITNDSAAVGKAVNLSDTKVSTVSGSMSLTVGQYGKSATINFGETGEDNIFESAQDMVNAINKQLGEQNIGGKKASTFMKAELKDGRIMFTSIGPSAGGNASEGDAVWVSGATGDLEKVLGLKPQTYYSADAQMSVAAPEGKLYGTRDPVEYYSNKTLNVTLDGVTKKVSIGDLTLSNEEKANGVTVGQKLVSNLQNSVRDAFGGKVKVEQRENGALAFTTTSRNSSLKVTSDVGEALGLGENGVSNYLDTAKTLGEILGVRTGTSELDVPDMSAKDAKTNVGEVTVKNGVATDSKGNTVVNINTDPNKEAEWRQVDAEGNLVFSMKINGKDVGSFTRETALESVLSAINNSDAGVKVSYSQLTNKFTFNATESGAQGRIDFEDPLSQALFGKPELNLVPGTEGDTSFLTNDAGEKITGIDKETGIEYYVQLRSDGKYYRTKEGGAPFVELGADPIDESSAELAELLDKARKGYTAGQDAIFSTTVNGDTLELTRSTNTVNIDGLNVTLKGTFNEDYRMNGAGKPELPEKDGDGNAVEGQWAAMLEDDRVSFTTKADADKIVEAVKAFVEEYNAICTEVRKAYTTQPLERNSSGDRYEPLTDEERADMSENEIKTYEEKAKTGILFGDTDLRRAYEGLRSAITAYGDDRKAMEAIGLTTEYSSGLTTLALDEEKLRSALDNNPDSVMKAFTDSKEYGASSDGLMARVKKTMDTYSSTSIGKYGVLVRKAGTKTHSLSLMDNYLQKKINRLDDDIDKWQSRMSDKIDFYSKQFTQLEQLMNQMNSQSSSLAGLMGGY